MKLGKILSLAVLSAVFSLNAFADEEHGEVHIWATNHAERYVTLHACDGNFTYQRSESGKSIALDIAVNDCSRIEFENAYGWDIKTDKLDTTNKPYTGSYRVFGEGHEGNYVVLYMHSKSDKHSDRIYIHF